MNNFSYSHSVFYPFGELSTIFVASEIVVCNLLKFGQVWNFLFGKGFPLTDDYCLESGLYVGKQPKNKKNILHCTVNPYRHNKILGQTKLKAFADDKLNLTKMIIFVFDTVENIVGKREIACTSNFSFSHNVFKRLLSQTHQKVSFCGNGLKRNSRKAWMGVLAATM